ncbi:MAG: HPF/RaiA family ribosome-associated protein [Planctomycetes bacterium]|nr:HPF/RaiA family ribosome-associated protein [Planctomycetota bacterium]
MQLAMHAHGLAGRRHDRLFRLAAERADAALGRLADRVAGVVLRLSDENGPKGGRALRCVATLQLVGGGSLVSTSLSSDWQDACSRALDRAATLVKRCTGRKRSLERR